MRRGVMSTFYELLAQIQRKPGLYLGSPSISSLYMFLNGYQFARRQLNLPLSAQEREFQAFQPWLQQKYGIKSSQSWSQLILLRSSDEREAFERFFALLPEFQRCRENPQSIASAEAELEVA
jgi:hypothetical protein